VGGVCDVLVCDGFVGNLFIKQAEAIVRLATELALAEIKRDLPRRLLPGMLPAALLLGMKRTRAGAMLGMLGAMPALFGSVMIPALLRFRTKADYRAYGGAPLLGLRGVAIVAHGKSDAEAVASAIRQAKEAVERRSVTGIADAIGMNGSVLARGR
ncbi:MAG TPA: hypothetical protein VFO07_12575, partial [Roseiflexaceae bacterium]|nr:hypothetical protein [Roseiflexaceae bacterium]